ncbi:putative ribonuclease H2 subunit B, wHTH domain, rnh202, triple barrel domain-containing protein [Helianthus annuus]|nr:putative ribonuclease H2 subunit B, wHTH domain, rnh202, triple barrel domain-containing protein [Helianthus annuus]
MAWYDGLEETRVLVASSDSSATGDDTGRLLQLRHPKTGDSTSYLLINGGLQELNWFKQSYGSWFMGDYICEDGGLYAATPVDPVFILLPMFDQARMKNGNDPGKFRQLDEIIYIHDYPGYRCLSTIAESSMQIVCDFKEIGSTKFFRLNDSKVLAWMLCKVQQLKQTLVKLDKNYAARSEKEILADVVTILGEYLADDPWYKVLCDSLRLNMVEAVDVTDMKIDSVDTSTPSSFNPTVQEQTTNDKRVTRSAKPNKKAKVETNSHSIKDMFSRASRRGK